MEVGGAAPPAPDLMDGYVQALYFLLVRAVNEFEDFFQLLQEEILQHQQTFGEPSLGDYAHFTMKAAKKSHLWDVLLERLWFYVSEYRDMWLDALAVSVMPQSFFVGFASGLLQPIYAFPQFLSLHNFKAGYRWAPKVNSIPLTPSEKVFNAATAFVIPFSIMYLSPKLTSNMLTQSLAVILAYGQGAISGFRLLNKLPHEAEPSEESREQWKTIVEVSARSFGIRLSPVALGVVVTARYHLWNLKTIYLHLRPLFP